MPVKYTNKLPDFIKGLRTWEKDVTKALTQVAAETVQKAIQDEIPPPKKGQWKLRASLPDEEGEGNLKAAIMTTSPSPIGGSSSAWHAKVYVDMSGEVGKYALIHEIGGTITSFPGGPKMTFVYPPNSGQYISLRTVRIRPKEYFSHGVKLGRDEFRRIASDIVAAPTGRGSKYRSRTTGRFIKFPF